MQMTEPVLLAYGTPKKISESVDLRLLNQKKTYRVEFHEVECDLL